MAVLVVLSFFFSLLFVAILFFQLRIAPTSTEQRKNRKIFALATLAVILSTTLLFFFSMAPKPVGFAPATVGLQGLQEGEGYVVVHSRMIGPGEWVVLLRSDDVNLRTGEYDYIVRRMDSPLPKNFHVHNGKPQEFIKTSP